jgi:hypothetical protein
MVDATIVPVPKQRNSREENEAVKIGKTRARFALLIAREAKQWLRLSNFTHSTPRTTFDVAPPL